MRKPLIIGALVLFTLSGAAWADSIILDAVEGTDFENPGSTVMDARYRISGTNWDQMIATSSSISTTTIVQTQNLGGVATLNQDVWNFSMSYVAGTGYTFTLTEVTDANTANLITGSSTVSWTSPQASTGSSPTEAYNAIHLLAVANLRTPITASQIDVTNLVFTSSTLTQTGGPLTNLNDTNSLTFDEEWLVADTNLALHNWTLTGTVVAQYTGSAWTGDGGETLKFDILTTNVDLITPVPEPATVTVMGLGLAGLAAVRGLRSRFASKK